MWYRIILTIWLAFSLFITGSEYNSSYSNRRYMGKEDGKSVYEYDIRRANEELLIALTGIIIIVGINSAIQYRKKSKNKLK